MLMAGEKSQKKLSQCFVFEFQGELFYGDTFPFQGKNG
jgi:hypothetical protein